MEKGLALEPSNAGLLEAQTSLMEREMGANAEPAAGANGMAKLFNSPDVWAKLGAHPSTSGYLADPSFVQTIKNLQQHPEMIGGLMRDPRVMQAVGVILGIDLNAGGEGMGMPGSRGEPMETDAPKAEKKAPAAAEKPKAKEPEPVPEEELTEEEKAAREVKAKANAEKDLGNEAYKKKDFATATKHYLAASELCPAEMSYVSNLAAVDLETGHYAECIDRCKKAIELGRAARADYSLIAKAFDRMGKAHLKLDQLAEAIEAFNKSLSENRTADVLTRLRDTEKLKRTRDAEAYIDPEKARLAKEKGDEDFKGGRFPEAIKHYEEAILRSPNDPKLYSNKAACYQKLGAFPEVIKDCDKAISLDKTFVKAYSRKAHAQFLMKEYHKAMETYRAGLVVDPNNADLLDGLQKALAKVHGEADPNESEEQRVERAMRDPEIQQILSDPGMRLILESMKTEPGAFQNHIKNPDVATKIQKLMDAGIIRVGGR